jgi:hypothetical protein
VTQRDPSLPAWRRRGLILTLWLWGIVISASLITLGGIALRASGGLRGYPTPLLVLDLASSALLVVAGVATLRFRRLGLFGLYFVFGTNFLEALIGPQGSIAWRAMAQLVAAAIFGVLVWRVWDQFE